MVEEVVTKPVHTTQPVLQQEVVIKTVHTTQPAQQEEVHPKPVYTAQPIQQVPGTQQPECRHSEVVVQDHAVSQDQVLLKVATKQVHTAQPVQQEKVETKPVVTAHQVLHDEDPYKSEMFFTMVSHQVLHYEDPYTHEESPSMVPHQVRQYEDNYKGEMSSTMIAHHAPVHGQPPQPPLHQQGQVQHQKDPYIGEEGIQQVPVIQQGDQYEGAMVKEVVTQPVLHEEVVIPANTAQPFQQEKEFVIKQVDIAQRCTTSPQESDNNRQAQSKQ